MGYDIIGDIHGQGGKLRALLRSMGYVSRGVVWTPPQGRQAVFLGDLIDRGPDQIEVLAIVRSMVDAGRAHAVMGNHEFNAIGYATQKRGAKKGDVHLRPHSAKNMAQHAEFLRQVGEGSALHRELVAWFRTLPVALDLGGIRAVHAWWHQPFVDEVSRRLSSEGFRDREALHDAHEKGASLCVAIEGLTKGLEIKLPSGHSFVDHSGVERFDVRTRWWLTQPRTFRDVAIVGDSQEEQIPDLELPVDFVPSPVEGSPVFVGHYWMTGQPRRLTPKLACLDYSAGKHGPLVAYRWDGEAEIDPNKFVQASLSGRPAGHCF